MQNNFKFGLNSSGGVSWKFKNGTSFWPCSCGLPCTTLLFHEKKSKACDPSLPTIQTWLNRTEWLMASHCAAETFKLPMKKDRRFVSSLAARTVLKLSSIILCPTANPSNARCKWATPKQANAPRILWLGRRFATLVLGDSWSLAGGQRPLYDGNLQPLQPGMRGTLQPS